MDSVRLQEASEDISMILAKMNAPEEVFAFLRDLLSEKELVEFSRRFRVAKMLSEKIPYSTIEAETGMSSTTIARISKFLSGEFGGYRNALSVLKSITDRHHTGHRLRDL